MSHTPHDEIREVAERIAGLASQGRQEDALAEGRVLAGRHPRRPEARLLLGVLLADSGRPEEAEAALRDCLALWPGLHPARRRLAELLLDRRDFGGALEAFRTLAASRSDDAHAWNGVAVAALFSGRSGEAEAAARRAAALDPRSAGANLILAQALAAQDRGDEALVAARRSVELDKRSGEAHDLVGRLLAQRGEYLQAAEAFRSALDAGAGEVTASRLGDALLQAGDAAGAVLAYEAAQSGNRADGPANGSRALFAMHLAEDRTAASVYEAHLAWARRYAAPTSPRAFTNTRDPDRRLRIGYVSSRFRASSAAFLLVPVLERHDPAAVEFHCYAEQGDADEVTARIRATASGWTDTRALDDEALADAIRQDGIDILVDLAGHTPGNRLPALSRKPAPVMLTWLDYCDTTGCGAFDAIVTDSGHSPPGDGQRFAERRLRVEPLRYCYAPPAHAPAVAPLPSASGRGVTFGAFHRLSKVGPTVLRAWSELLALDARFRLIVKSDGLGSEEERRRHLARFAAAGLPADRVELRPTSPHAEALRQYGDVDIALDTFPYNGGITTLEALWMGRPVIAVEGDTLISRQSSAILRAAGMGELVAGDARAMVELAARLASDPGRLSRCAKDLRERLFASPVCDAAAFTRRLESAYRTAWRNWCATLPVGEPA